MIPLDVVGGGDDPATGPAADPDPEAAASRYDCIGSHSDRLQWLVEEAAAIAAVPKAAINLMNATTQRTLASVGVDITVLAREHTLCGGIIDEGRAVHVPDASRDPRWAHHPFIDGRWGRTRFIGAHPLVGPDGRPVGVLCVMDLRPRVLEPWQVVALEELVPRVLEALELERSRALAEPAPSSRA
ncbi:MAG: cph1 3 [Marmoricola sp.]|nr:cph1 3 [Marmoricola sp.]